MTGKDIIRAQKRLAVFMRRRRTVRLQIRLWLQRLVDVGTVRRVK